MNLIHKKERNVTQSLIKEFEAKKLSIEAQVALMSTGVQIPVQFVCREQFSLIPSEYVAGGIAQWRVFFANENEGISAAHNSWNRGCVMINHNHLLYDEYIYVVDGRLKDHLTGDIITTPEMAQELYISPEKAAQMRENVQGWYFIPAGQDHLILALEDSEFIVKFVRR